MRRKWLLGFVIISCMFLTSTYLNLFRIHSKQYDYYADIDRYQLQQIPLHIQHNANNCTLIGGNEYFNPVYNLKFNSKHQKCVDFLYSDTKRFYRYDYGTAFEEWLSSKKLRIIFDAKSNSLPLLAKSAVDYWDYQMSTTADLTQMISYFDADIAEGKNSSLWLIHRFGNKCGATISSKNTHNIPIPLPSILDKSLDQSKYFTIDICIPREFLVYSNKWKEYQALKKFDSFPQVKKMYNVSYYNSWRNIYPETFGFDKNNINEIKKVIQSATENDAWIFKISHSNFGKGIYLKNSKFNAIKFLNNYNFNQTSNLKAINNIILAQKVLKFPWLINGKYIGRIRPYVIILSLNPLKALVCKEFALARAVKKLIINKSLKSNQVNEPLFEWESLIVNIMGQKKYRQKYVKNDRRSMYILWDLKKFVISGIDEYDTPKHIEYREHKLKTNLYNTIKYHLAALHFDMMSKRNKLDEKYYNKYDYESSSNSMFLTEYCIDMAVDMELNTYIMETNTFCAWKKTPQVSQLFLDRGLYKISITQEYLFRKWSLQQQNKYDLQFDKPHGVSDEWISNFGDWIVLFDQKDNHLLNF
eukprot:521777_1